MKQIIIILLTINCSLITVNCSAQLQGQAKLDSLLAELSKAKEDTNKVLLLTELSFYYSSINPEEGIKYGQQGLALAEQLGWKKGIAYVGNSLGSNYTAKSDYPKALEYYFKALKRHEEVNSGSIPVLLVNIGIVYGYIKNHPKSLEYFERALKLLEEKGDKRGIAYTLVNIGLQYSDGPKDYPKALDYYIRARKIAEEIGDKYAFAAATGNLGDIYSYTKQYKMALAYMYSALHISEEIGNKLYIAIGLQDIGDTYLKIAKAEGGANTVGNLSEVPAADLPSVTLPKGRTALLAEAEKHLTLALNLTTEMGDVAKMKNNYELLSEVYELQGDYKKSLAAHKEFLVFKDSVFNKENTTKIAKLEVKAEYEKQQLADSIQNAEAQKLADVKLQRQRTFTFGGVGAAVLLLAFSIFIFRNNKKLGFEKQKSEELLHNILPAEVASELKERGATTAQQYDNVTVLFTDFVDFTQAGEHMGSQALVEELHNCFEAFDNIMDKYGIEKIKTIGDAYLAVCGLPTSDERHAEKVVNAAKDIQAFMLQRRDTLKDKTFEVRIGVHSGSVVAGIVGVKKFAYDIWGDTVNTAARMESNSEAGKINISQTTYDLVKDKFSCTYRGEIEAKGKGMLKMYFVEG